MKRLANIIITLMAVTIAVPAYAQAGNQGLPQGNGVVLSEDQTYALDLINLIRRDPLGYAELHFGRDRETLIQELPWLRNSLEEGLPPCSPNQDLNLLAEQKNSPVDQDKVEGAGAEDREYPIESDFVLDGEMGGVVSFYSFMPPEFAWQIVIVNQLLQELSPDMQGPLYILNPRFNTVGMAMRGGPNEVDGEVINAYFATVCFVSSRLKAEAQVLNMVNQVRYSPLSISTYTGLSLIEILDYNFFSFSRWRWLYPYSPDWDSSNLPPLFENSSLNVSARNRALGLLNPDDPLLEQNIELMVEKEEAFEFDESVAKVMIQVDTDESFNPELNPDSGPVLTSQGVAHSLFTAMLHDELNSPRKRGAIFSVKTNWAGVGIALAHPIHGGWPAAVALHSAKKDPPPFHGVSTDESYPLPGTAPDNSRGENLVGIYGIVFFDTDGNEIYSPGEGRKTIPVDISRTSDDTPVVRTFTDASGYFFAELEKDQEYRFEISSGENRILFTEVFGRSSFLPVDLSLHSPLGSHIPIP